MSDSVLRKETIEHLFSPEQAKALQVAADSHVKRIDGDAKQNKERVAKICALAQSVLANKNGCKLLKELAAMAYFRPVFPPEQGMTAGEFAAYNQGSRNFVAMLINWTEQEDTK